MLAEKAELELNRGISGGDTSKASVSQLAPANKNLTSSWCQQRNQKQESVVNLVPAEEAGQESGINLVPGEKTKQTFGVNLVPAEKQNKNPASGWCH